MRPSIRYTALALTLLVSSLHSSASSQSPNLKQSFDIATLNARLQNEAGMSAEQCRGWMEARVRPLLELDGSQLETQIDIEGVKLVSDSTRRGSVVINDKLHVVAPKETQKRIQEFVDTFTRFGVRQIEIRTHVYRDTSEAMRSLPIQWSHVEAASSIAESPTASTVKQASHEQPLTAASRFIESQNAPVKEDLPPPQGVTDATWTEATSIVERSTPVLYSLLSPKDLETVLSTAKKQTTLKSLMAPSVIVFNGQIASVSNAVERPFVTGIKVVKLGPENKQQVEFAPKVKVYQEGTTMKILPELMAGKSIRLNCQLDLCKIRSVELHKIPGVEGRGEFSIQMPEVAVTKFRTCLDMPLDYSLAVSAFDTDEAGVKYTTVVLCSCSIRNIEPK